MMRHIVVEVQDQEKADLLYELLNALDFVTFVSTEAMNDDNTREQSLGKSSEEFFAYAGLWAERDVTFTSIRQQAWPRHDL